jgi:hypothetical protein
MHHQHATCIPNPKRRLFTQPDENLPLGTHLRFLKRGAPCFKASRKPNFFRCELFKPKAGNRLQKGKICVHKTVLYQNNVFTIALAVLFPKTGISAKAGFLSLRLIIECIAQ